MTEVSASDEAAQVAWLWRDLAGRRGFPEIIESAAAVLPESTTANVVYDLGVAVSLALGDLADAVEVAPRMPGLPPAS